MGSDAQSAAVADALKSLVEQTLEQKLGLELSGESTVDEREIIEYNSRMRVGGLEKFNGPCYVCAVNYYGSEQSQASDEAAGTVIFYFEESNAEKILKALDHRGFDEDDEKFVLKHLGEFGQSLSQDFAQRLEDLGYKRLLLSDVSKDKNNIAQGMAFPYNRYNYHEIGFHLWNKKILVASVTLAPVSSIS